MVVLMLTLVESAKSVNLVSAGRVGDRLRSMDNLIVRELAGVSTHRHIVARLDFLDQIRIRFLLWHDWLDGIDWVIHSFTHLRGLTTDSYPITRFPMTKYEPWNLPL